MATHQCDEWLWNVNLSELYYLYASDSGGILCSGCPCIRPWKYTRTLLTRYLINRLWEFHQNYNFGADGDKDKLIRFWGFEVKKVKGQGHSETALWSIKHCGRYFLTYLLNALWSIKHCSHVSLECMKTDHNFSIPRLHNSDNIFKVMESKVKVTDNMLKNALLWRSTEDHLVWTFSRNVTELYIKFSDLYIYRVNTKK